MQLILKIIRKGLALAVLSISIGFSYAQPPTTIVPPIRISIGFTKTTHLIFPNRIISVDRGSNSILIQKAKGVENVLQLKAAQKGFQQTNVTVITSDGGIYSMLLDYVSDPDSLTIQFNKDTASIEKSTLLTIQQNDNDLETTANRVLWQRPFLHVANTDQKITLQLNSIYLSGNLMWFTLTIKNKSQIGYNLENLHLIIKDKHRGKRTALQQNIVLPVFKIIPPAINGDSSERILIACEPFTITGKQKLVIQVAEKNGGRNSLLPIASHTLLKARLLNDTK